MSLIPTVFRSTDPGAPILTGTAGSFAALMDAVLVTGYGSGADTKTPLGWERSFSDGAKRAYRNSLVDGGTGFYWRIDDSAAQYALCSGYHSMSGIDTGVDQFGGGANAWGKSITAGTTPRGWVIVGNSRTVYVFLQNGNPASSTSYAAYLVGDYECVRKSYVFNFGISFTGVATITTGVARTNLLTSSAGYGEFRGARSYDGAVVNPSMPTRSSIIMNQSVLGGSGGAPHPYPPTGAMLASRVTMSSGGYFFGLAPGLWSPEHASVLTRFTEVSAIPGLPAGPWLAIEAMGGSPGQGLLQLNVPWAY